MTRDPFPVDVQEKVGALALLAHQLDKPPSYCLDPYFIFFPHEEEEYGTLPGTLELHPCVC